MATVICAAAAVVAGCAGAYRCEDDGRVVARYYSLSDRSLDFVKLVMPDGREHTLPRVVSASGARYSDGLELVWWTKGSSAFSQVRAMTTGGRTGAASKAPTRSDEVPADGRAELFR